MTPEGKKIEEAAKNFLSYKDKNEGTIWTELDSDIIKAFVEFSISDTVKEYWQKDMFSKEFVLKLMKSIGVANPANCLEHFLERQDPLTKTLLKETYKEKIWIEGFNEEDQLYAFTLKADFDTCIYAGKVSDINEELAKDLADKGLLCEFYWNESTCEYDKNITASESVQSHCKQEYCVIYKSQN